MHKSWSGNIYTRLLFLGTLFLPSGLKNKWNPIVASFRQLCNMDSSSNSPLMWHLIWVATAQGKRGIWKYIFPDRENKEFAKKNIKNMFLPREFATNTGKNLKLKEKACNLKQEKFTFATSLMLLNIWSFIICNILSCCHYHMQQYALKGRKGWLKEWWDHLQIS